MIFILIPLAWLTIIAFVVSVCQAAARGDAAAAQTVETSDRSLPLKVVVSEQSAAPPAVHHPRRCPPLVAGRRVRDRRLLHGVR